jgi:hypothetical protein
MQAEDYPAVEKHTAIIISAFKVSAFTTVVDIFAKSNCISSYTTGKAGDNSDSLVESHVANIYVLHFK